MAETLIDPMLGRLIDGRYEVREHVARGGMASVYIAFDRRLERSVAIKVMNPIPGVGDNSDFASRFRREAKAAARLTHPGLVRVYDQGTDGDISYLTMEYVEGQNLRTLISHESTLRVGDALRIIDSVLDALAAAHRQGLVHRDVKPENVLIDDAGAPKLADFGLARAVNEVTATSTGMIMGTVAYLGPELISRGQADARTDVYACGILLYEMITGRQPFSAPSAIEVASMHVHQEVPAPSILVPWLPPEIDDLVTTLAARDPNARPADASLALARVRQTRAMVDDPTLDRRADPPSTPTPVVDADGNTVVLHHLAAGATVALPIGLGEPLVGLGGLHGEGMDDDPDATSPENERIRTGMWIGGILAGILLILGLAGWWYTTQGPGSFTTVPPVAGATSEEAQQILSSVGLDFTVELQFSDSVANGFAIGTDPEEQSQIAKDGTVTLFVSQGQLMLSVPVVVGILEEDALVRITEAGFEDVGETVYVYDDNVPAGEVMSSNPRSPSSVPHSTKIVLTVSEGPEPIVIPDVIGMAEAEAVTMLSETHALNVSVVYERTAEQPKGMVFNTDPEPGSDGLRTQDIALYVSDGPPLVTVPNVKGQDFNDARDVLEALGFVVTGKNEPWNFSKIVFSQDPEAGQEVEPGSTIHLLY